MSSHSEIVLGPKALVSEAARIAFSAPVTSTLVLLVVAAMSTVALSTTGQTVRAEQAVLARIDDAGTRLVLAIDDQGSARIDPGAVGRIGRLSTVDWVFGLGFAADARNSTLIDFGNPVATREFWGELPNVVSVDGRLPNPGEAIVGTSAVARLGLVYPIGSIDIRDTQSPIVGRFEASDPLAELNNTVLRAPPGNEESSIRLRSVYVLAATPSDVAALSSAIPALLGADEGSAVRLETSETLAELRAAVAGELGRFSRRLIIGAMVVGLFMVMITVYGSVTLRRQDFGRRRALGAHRGIIVGLIAVQYGLVALVGAFAGGVLGSFWVMRFTGGPPRPTFVIAIAALSVVATIVAAVPPALIAAFRDPVRVLRVP